MPSRGVWHCGHSSATTAVASTSKPGGEKEVGGVEAGDDDELDDAGRDP